MSSSKSTRQETAHDDLSRLAVFGGTPAFDDQLHVGRPNIGDRERLFARIGSLLDRRWLTNSGPYVQEFEQRIAATVGVKHCIAICNATVALEIPVRPELKWETERVAERPEPLELVQREL